MDVTEEDQRGRGPCGLYGWYMKTSMFSNIIKGQTKATLGIRQLEDHVRPGLTSRVPTIYMLLSSLS